MVEEGDRDGRRGKQQGKKRKKNESTTRIYMNFISSIWQLVKLVLQNLKIFYYERFIHKP